MNQPQIDLIPSDEERQMRETVAAICTDMGGPRYTREKVANGEPPTELWDALASRGYLGVNVPEEYGGSGLGMSALAAVGEEITAQGCALILIVVSPAIVGSILARHGTPDQKERWLRPIGEGRQKIAFRITQPDAGRRRPPSPSPCRTRARPATTSRPPPRPRTAATASAARRPTSAASRRPTGS